MTDEAEIIAAYKRCADEPSEPCLLCQEQTEYRAVIRPFAKTGGLLNRLIEISRALCPDCLADMKSSARTLARVLASFSSGAPADEDEA